MRREILNCYYLACETEIMSKLLENPDIVDSESEFERKLESLAIRFNIPCEELDSVLSAKNLFEARILQEMYLIGFQDGEKVAEEKSIF